MGLRDGFVRAGSFLADDQSGHRIYYEDYGPRDSVPLVMVHGNGGALFDRARLSMIDTTRQRVIFIHARGVGASTPAGKIEHNQYPDLVRDIEQMRKLLDLRRVMLCGWSGGTAVALMYAQAHPQHCAGLVLAGTYLASGAEIAGYYDRVAQRCPLGWAEFTRHYGTDNPVAAFNREVTAARGTAELLAVTARYEMIFENGRTTRMDLLARHDAEKWRAMAAGRRVYAHMMLHDCGILRGQVENGMARLGGVPVLFVNGAADHITPPDVAAKLCAMTARGLHIVIPGAGHDIHDPKMQQALTGLLRDFPANVVPVRPFPPAPSPR